tara:strand:+ start:83744 stop:84928 length:1185 start_codon:yes stop_codon:yes gene_type:complete
MEKSLLHHHPYFDRHEKQFNNSVWDLVRKANDEKKTKVAFYQSLNYINSDSHYNESLLESKSLRVMQGGRPVDIIWDDSKIFFETTLLNYKDGTELASLRKLSEFSFFDLKLVQLKIRNDKIILKYEDQWEAMDPYKFFDIMEDLCNFGDFLESYMVKKFKFESPNQAARTPESDKRIDAAWSLFQQLSLETKEYLNDFEKKRYRDTCVEVFWNYLQKIDYIFSPRGYLKLELKSAYTDLNPNTGFETMYAKIFTNFKKISEITKENFQSSFYKEPSFMPARRVAYVERTKLHFDDYLKNAFQYRNKQDYILASLYLNTAIYSFLNRYFCEPELATYLRNLLVRASGVSWKTASERLYTGLEKYLINQNLIYHEAVNFESALNIVIGWFKRISR